jgi:hypothetical protein
VSGRAGIAGVAELPRCRASAQLPAHRSAASRQVPLPRLTSLALKIRFTVRRMRYRRWALQHRGLPQEFVLFDPPDFIPTAFVRRSGRYTLLRQIHLLQERLVARILFKILKW